jgi:hypothetical protein
MFMVGDIIREGESRTRTFIVERVVGRRLYILPHSNPEYDDYSPHRGIPYPDSWFHVVKHAHLPSLEELM